MVRIRQSRAAGMGNRNLPARDHPREHGTLDSGTFFQRITARCHQRFVRFRFLYFSPKTSSESFGIKQDGPGGSDPRRFRAFDEPAYERECNR